MTGPDLACKLEEEDTEVSMKGNEGLRLVLAVTGLIYVEVPFEKLDSRISGGCSLSILVMDLGGELERPVSLRMNEVNDDPDRVGRGLP
jgi:hypothetical protein